MLASLGEVEEAGVRQSVCKTGPENQSTTSWNSSLNQNWEFQSLPWIYFYSRMEHLPPNPFKLLFLIHGTESYYFIFNIMWSTIWRLLFCIFSFYVYELYFTDLSCQFGWRCTLKKTIRIYTSQYILQCQFCTFETFNWYKLKGNPSTKSESFSFSHQKSIFILKNFS